MKSSLHARRMARNHRRARQGKSGGLILTAVIDIFTVLLFFLMVSGGDENVLQKDKGINLPKSVADQQPSENLLIKISATDVIVQGRAVARVADVLAQPEQIIKALDDELQLLTARLPPLTSAEQENGRAVTIMGDQQVPYKLLKKVMTTCAQADYRNISLATDRLFDKVPDVSALPVLDQES